MSRARLYTDEEVERARRVSLKSIRRRDVNEQFITRKNRLERRLFPPEFRFLRILPPSPCHRYAVIHVETFKRILPRAIHATAVQCTTTTATPNGIMQKRRR